MANDSKKTVAVVLCYVTIAAAICVTGLRLLVRISKVGFKNLAIDDFLITIATVRYSIFWNSFIHCLCWQTLNTHF